MNRNPKNWDKENRTDVIKISYLNCRSLVNRFENIKTDVSLKQSDVLVLAETWIPNTVEDDKFELKNYEAHLNNTGRGKGLALFYKMDAEKVGDHNEDKINISKIEFVKMDVIAVYRSENANLDSLNIKLKEILNLSKSTTNVVFEHAMKSFEN